MLKKSFIALVLLFSQLVLTGCVSGWIGNHSIEVTGEKSFIDSTGREVVVASPYQKVVTLYSAHTENAYVIGAGDQLIGVGTTSIYPPEAAFLPKYDYRSDPEPLIAAEPDLVLIRPFIHRNYSDFVRAIEKAGIEVISLYPEDSDSFEPYVQSLGILFGKTEEVAYELADLNERVSAVADITASVLVDDQVTVYFESTKTAYRTVTTDSNPARAIEVAGGINIASDVRPITKGSTIADFGIEQLMLHGDDIDVYISQRGAMNAGGSLISIPQREGFRAIKAVEEGRILELNEKIISSPTFRYDKGVREMARMFYPELMDDVTAFRHEEYLTRTDYAELTVKINHTPIFVPSSAHYYEQTHKVHSYGLFEDVPWTAEKFDWIETAVLSSYIRGYRGEDYTEFFDGESLVTRSDLAYTLYIIHEVKGMDNHLTINDLDQCKDEKIVQKIIDHGLMTLDAKGNFNPEQPVSGIDALKILTQEVLND